MDKKEVYTFSHDMQGLASEHGFEVDTLSVYTEKGPYINFTLERDGKKFSFSMREVDEVNV